MILILYHIIHYLEPAARGCPAASRVSDWRPQKPGGLAVRVPSGNTARGRSFVRRYDSLTFGPGGAAQPIGRPGCTRPAWLPRLPIYMTYMYLYLSLSIYIYIYIYMYTYNHI